MTDQSIPTKTIWNRNNKSIAKRNSSMIFWKKISLTTKFFLVLGKISNIPKNSIPRVHPIKKPKPKFMKKSSGQTSKNLAKRKIVKSKKKMNLNIKKSIHSKWPSTTNPKVRSSLIQKSTNWTHQTKRIKKIYQKQKIQPNWVQVNTTK